VDNLSDVTVIDVRRRPTACRIAFRRETLECALPRYESYPELGNAGSAETWVVADGDAVNTCLEALARRIQAGEQLLLLCAEPDPRDCHREQIAAVLSLRTGSVVQHLR